MDTADVAGAPINPLFPIENPDACATVGTNIYYIFFKELCRHYIGQSPALSRDLSINSYCTVTICPEFCVDVDCKTKNNASILKNASYKKKNLFC